MHLGFSRINLLSFPFMFLMCFLCTSISNSQENIWNYTGEVGFSLESVDSSGSQSSSSRGKGTALFNDFEISGEKEISNGARYTLDLSSHTPLYQRRKQEKRLRFTTAYESDNTSLQVGDMVPRTSSWTLSGKNLVGLQYSRDLGSRKYQVTVGKARNNVSTTQDDRIVLDSNIVWKETDRFTVSSEYISTFDRNAGVTGTRQEKNNIFQTKMIINFETGKAFEVEYANSTYSNSADPSSLKLTGNALRISTTFSVRDYKIKLSYEDIGDDFRTLSGYSSYGRRVFLNEITTPIGQKLVFNTGYSSNDTQYQAIESFPVTLSYKPFENRKVNVVFDHRRQRVSGTADITTNRSSGVKLTNKLRRHSYSLGTRREIYRSGETASRVLFADLTTLIKSDVSMKLKASRDVRRGESDNRHKYHIGFNWDIGEWSRFQVSRDLQDSGGRGRKRNTTKAKLHIFDSAKNYELDVNYQDIDRGTYKDKIFSSDISFFF